MGICAVCDYGHLNSTRAKLLQPRICCIGRGKKHNIIDRPPFLEGQGDDGNQFVFDGKFWAFNLSTKGLAPGTYTITAVSGNLSEYVIDPTCTAVVEIE
jgi:hypothetical protein